VCLIDMQGNVVHTWKMPYPPGLYGYLTEKGTLFYNGQIRNDTWIGKQPYMGGAAMEADWNGKVLWEIKQPDHHHDGLLLRNGNVLLLCSAELPANVAMRVRGGLAGTEHDADKIDSDYLVEKTKDGRTVWEWRAWEHMEPDAYPITSPSDSRSEWTHGNGIAELPDGDILVSFRNISTVRINRRTGTVPMPSRRPRRRRDGERRCGSAIFTSPNVTMRRLSRSNSAPLLRRTSRRTSAI